ncbi:PTS system, maltose and glucose-specific IIC component [Clostridium sp. USBA 49]|jgi:PTS system maltose and glucose-specific IIC component|uniref:PTS transporter subunit EIIC n=1 Tax=Clostridium sp. USBA 49 TaxID=1881060 RepID=UPI000999B3BC|nr:PTS transporter subunit EIIC [Clostridium sp. USBA 49]SKA73960.1 PTS system, maltose and glucose-specific IIC component [Clostridium sp. USBA 49]
MKNFKKNFQSFGKSLLFPISLLSFMAIFLGLSSALQNANIIKMIPFLGSKNLQIFIGLIRKVAGLPFTYLPLLFALAIPLGMVKRDKEVAVYSAAVGYIALLLGMNYILSIKDLTPATTAIDFLMKNKGMSQVDATLTNSLFTNTLGIFVYNTNVIGGILAGILAVVIHNKFRNTELHPSLSFYSGKRFVPIISALIMVIVGMLLTFIWPAINSLIVAAGKLISQTGLFGVFLYGFTEKIINPTGLHHILNQTFRFTALGGVETINGKNLVGALQIYLYQLENNLPFSTNATQFLAQGKILHMVFGMPAAVYAIYRRALPEKRDKVLKFYIAGLTAVILTGITEPIEFTFIFISPILWIVNAIFAGLAFLVPAIFNAAIGNIQGGIIDWLVFGVLQGAQTKWYIYLFLGPIFFAMYYFAYSFIISKFNVMTLGRKETDFIDSEEEAEISKSLTGSDHDIAKNIIEGLGGLENILDVDNCISRLRVELKDGSKVNRDLINKTKPNGIVTPDKNTIHIVYGGRITKIRNLVDDYIYSLKQMK